MPKKAKFKPQISKVKLNYEQAVLACSCHTNSAIQANTGSGHSWHAWVCYGPSGSRQVSWRRWWFAVAGMS
ncbi:MAG: hypothetical protein PHS09_00785 [Candidatus Omnitrophica bacterium]|nr:hypothetical protein [Candidatus Omnitrophota bacterium]